MYAIGSWFRIWGTDDGSLEGRLGMAVAPDAHAFRGRLECASHVMAEEEESEDETGGYVMLRMLSHNPSIIQTVVLPAYYLEEADRPQGSYCFECGSL